MIVPFLDLKRETNAFRGALEDAALRVIRSGRYVLGAELEFLETEFSRFIGIPFAAGVNSGTDALTLALEASGAIHPGEGDEVVTTVLSAAFTSLAICRAGAVPRFADVDPLTLQIDPGCIEKLISPRTRAILPVHLYGHSCDMKGIGAIARTHRLAVIEDACQAHGSRLDGACLGTLGLAAGFSFYPTKNLGAFGDGGMVVAHEEEIIRRVKQLRHGGQSQTYHHELRGCNSRLDELQAAVLRCKLERLEARNEERRRLASGYDAAFADLEISILPVAQDLTPNRHLYPVRTGHRDPLRLFLAGCGVATLVHYPAPLSQQPALREFLLPGQTFPVAEKAAREVLSLPLFPELTNEEFDHTVGSVRRFFGC